MPEVSVMVEESRYIGADPKTGKSVWYARGDTKRVDAEIAGKYRQYLRPMTDSDRVEAEAAWARRLELEQERIDAETTARTIDPGALRLLLDLLSSGGLEKLTALLSGQGAAATRGARA